jgi:hypothetical protein
MISSISVHVYTNPDYTNRYPLIQCFACFKSRQRRHHPGQKPSFSSCRCCSMCPYCERNAISLRSTIELFVSTHLYEPFADMPTACLPVSVVSRNPRSFSLKISSPCELAALVMRNMGPQRLRV